MKLSKRTNTIILWVISIGLLVSMLIAFTPTLGGLFGSTSATADNSPTALLVNGKAISELDVARALQNSGQSSFEGEVAADLEILTLDNLVQTQLLEEAAANIRVSDAEVRTAVEEWRQQNNVAGRANDQRYLSVLGQAGYTDQSFRATFRDQLKINKYREQITENVTVTDEEVKAFYDLNLNNYQNEERIRARQIVVEDQELANQLFEELNNGADFALLAKENSVERADQEGALGAPTGSTEPQAVGRAALPTQVANAAFALQGEGLTDVISFNERFYIISIEEFIPSGPKTFEEVQDQVKEDALATKQSGILEQTFNNLRANATISTGETSTYSFNDEALAKVGDEEILRSDLARVVYNDPQVSQALRPDTADLITQLFKPSYLERLIDSELAFQGASQLDSTFIGPKNQIASNALQYVAKDASATEEEYQTYYDTNIARFTIPARAVVSRVNFDTEEAATAFRTTMLEGGDVAEIASTNGGEVVDLGTVNPGSLAPELDRVLFETEAFEAIPDSNNEISDVLVLTETIEVPVEESTDASDETDTATDENTDADSETTTDQTEETSSEETVDEIAETTDTSNEEATNEEATNEEATNEETNPASGDGANVVTEEVIDRYVVLIAERTPETVRPFEEVRQQVESSVLANKRAELQTNWLDSLRETIPVENLLVSTSIDPSSFETTPLEGDSSETPAEEGTTEINTGESESDTASEETSDDGSSTEEPSDETPQETSP